MSDLLVQAILIGLSAWRLAALLSYERGPYAIFQRFREWLLYEHDEDGKPTIWPGDWREVFSCVWCLGLYAAIAMYGLWQIEPLVVMVIAASSIVVIVERWNHG